MAQPSRPFALPIRQPFIPPSRTPSERPVVRPNRPAASPAIPEPELSIVAADPFTSPAYRARVGLPCLELSFSDVAAGKLPAPGSTELPEGSDGEIELYDIVVISFALHLVESSSELWALLAELGKRARWLVITAPHKKPEVRSPFASSPPVRPVHRFSVLRSSRRGAGDDGTRLLLGVLRKDPGASEALKATGTRLCSTASDCGCIGARRTGTASRQRATLCRFLSFASLSRPLSPKSTSSSTPHLFASSASFDTRRLGGRPQEDAASNVQHATTVCKDARARPAPERRRPHAGESSFIALTRLEPS